MGNSMLIKSIIATIIAAAVTGSSVYVAQNSQNANPHDQRAEHDALSAHDEDDRGRKIHDEKITVSKLGDAAVYGAKSAKQSISKLINKTKVAAAHRREKTGLEENSGIYPEADEAEIISSENRKKNTGKTRRKTVKTVTETMTVTNDDHVTYAPAFVKSILGQIDKIRSDELKDQAYFDLVDYALKNKDFDVAERVMAMIEDRAMRDTSRNRIALKYALIGRSAEAFAVIETVENSELRDFLRLQVVQALIAPERLPQAALPG